MNVPGTNTGHGHVWKRPDGIKVPCGGPYICSQCAIDKAAYEDITPIYTTKESRAVIDDTTVRLSDVMKRLADR